MNWFFQTLSKIKKNAINGQTEDVTVLKSGLNKTEKIIINQTHHYGAPPWRGRVTKHCYGDYLVNLIPNNLRDSFIKECNQLKLNKNKFDYRSENLQTNNCNCLKIQDIIDPNNDGTIDTLFTGDDDGITSNVYGLAEQIGSYDTARKIREMKDSHSIQLYVSTKFEFNKQLNKYEIKSEIADLPNTNENQSIYKIIESIFNCMIPYIERGMNYNGICIDEKLNYSGLWEYITHKYSNKLNNMEYELKDVYNVIIKLTEYQFTDVNGYYSGGHFHSEGFEADNIDGIGLYYFGLSENILGGNLQFEQKKAGGLVSSHGGDVNVRNNMCVFFDNNSYNHRVSEINLNQNIKCKTELNKGYDKVYGKRSVLGFFIQSKGNYKPVNYQYKIDILLKYLLDIDNITKYDQNISNIIAQYTFGDKKWFKEMCDFNRELRYNYSDYLERKYAQKSRKRMCD